MSYPLLSLLSEQALDDLRSNLYTAIRTDMAAIIEPAFAKAWNNAWARLSGASVVEGEVLKVETPPAEKVLTVRAKPFNRAKWGASEKVIRLAFAAPGFKGMTPSEIAEWGGANGHPIAASSVRTTLKKMRVKGEAKVRQGKYSPRSPSGRTARDESPAAGAPGKEEVRLNGAQQT